MLPYVHAEWAHTVEIEHIYLLSNALCAACQCVQCKCPHLPPSIQIPPAAAMGAEDKLNPDNLVTLEVLEEHTMLAALKGRYATGKIYTAVGDILLALNPFKQLPLYTDRIKGLYHPNKDPSAVPHVYSTALTVYQNLSLFGKNQCCLISGESGACPSFLSLSRSLSPLSLSPVLSRSRSLSLPVSSCLCTRYLMSCSPVLVPKWQHDALLHPASQVTRNSIC